MRYLILALAILYIILPVDFDFVPVLGWIDDLFAAVVAFRAATAGARKLEG